MSSITFKKRKRVDICQQLPDLKNEIEKKYEEFMQFEVPRQVDTDSQLFSKFHSAEIKVSLKSLDHVEHGSFIKLEFNGPAIDGIKTIAIVKLEFVENWRNQRVTLTLKPSHEIEGLLASMPDMSY